MSDFSPAIPLGGAMEIQYVQKVKWLEQLDILLQLNQ